MKCKNTGSLVFSEPGLLGASLGRMRQKSKPHAGPLVLRAESSPRRGDGTINIDMVVEVPFRPIPVETGPTRKSLISLGCYDDSVLELVWEKLLRGQRALHVVLPCLLHNGKNDAGHRSGEGSGHKKIQTPFISPLRPKPSSAFTRHPRKKGNREKILRWCRVAGLRACAGAVIRPMTASKRWVTSVD